MKIAMLALLTLTAACGGEPFGAALHGPDANADDGQATDGALLSDGDAADASPDGGSAAADSAGPLDAAIDAGDTGADVVAHDGQGEAEAGPAACVCPGSSASCFYSVSEPAPTSDAAPYPVSTITLTPTAPTATWTETVYSPPVQYHDFAWTDVDVSHFAAGGTLSVNGQIGMGAVAVSTILTSECPLNPNGGPNWIENDSAISPGATWSFNHHTVTFAAGTTVLHIGSEGAWSGPTGASNTNKITASAQ